MGGGVTPPEMSWGNRWPRWVRAALLRAGYGRYGSATALATQKNRDVILLNELSSDANQRQ